MERRTAPDTRTLRKALGQFATGVAVVTAEAADGEMIGMTMNSFSSVSLDPPLILFSVDRKAYSLPAMEAAKAFGVNILSDGQQRLSDRFARALGDKWGDVRYRRGHGGAPLLDGALAQIECEPHARYDGGDHLIFVCRVLRVAIDPSGEPLVFFRGRYTAIDEGEQRLPAWPLSMHY